jgi:hypothetical protein
MRARRSPSRTGTGRRGFREYGHREGVELSSQTNLGKIDRSSAQYSSLVVARFLIPMGWVLAAVGYYGPWIAHMSAGLTLSGVDMGEFVKFLPGVQDGTLTVTRQLFYLPPFAIAMSIALLIGSRRLGYPWPLRILILLLAVPVSLQLLPPAWSPTSLMTAEFRLQTIAVGICWLLLASFWLLGHLPSWLTGSLSAGLAITAIGLTAWQFLVVKAAIDNVYRTPPAVPPAVGWGFPLCMGGLALLAAGSVVLILRTRMQSRASWSSK